MTTPRPGDWADYLPEAQRQQRLRLRRRLRRRALLRQPRFWLAICLVIYAFWCLALLLNGLPIAFGLALVPLISLPAIAALAWWLLWKEFHS